MAVFAIPNPKKSLTVDFPIEQVKKGVNNLYLIDNKYKLFNSNEIFNQYTFEALEFLSLGVYIDINLSNINENKNKNFSLEPEVFENDEIVYENEEAKLYAEASQHVTIPKKKDKTPPKKETSTVQQMDLFDFFVDRDE